MSVINYSKWDNIEISDDEDDTHPNVDTPSLHRWRHQARLDREAEAKRDKATRRMKLKTTERAAKNMRQEVEAMEKFAPNPEKIPDDKKKLITEKKSKLTELEKQVAEYEAKEAEIERQERMYPKWNVDNISEDKWNTSRINKITDPKPKSEEENFDEIQVYWKKYDKEIKEFGMLSKHEDSQKFLVRHPELVHEHMASKLVIWCIDLEVEGKHKLMERVAHQTIVIQYILEVAKSVKVDPRSCVSVFFSRVKTAEKQYLDAFNDEYKSFMGRVRERAQARVEKAMKEVEEEEANEREARLGPGGLDPLEVLETLPEKIKTAFETQNTPMLQEGFAELSDEDAQYHLKRAIDSGLWVPAKGEGDSDKDTEDVASNNNETTYADVDGATEAVSSADLD